MAATVASKLGKCDNEIEAMIEEIESESLLYYKWITYRIKRRKDLIACR